MTFKLFYTDYSKDKHVRSDEAVTETLENITKLMQSLLHEEDNFIGIIDDDNVMFQFMVDEDGSLIVDLPMHDRKVPSPRRLT
jgi:IMP cyclohydrolase